MSSLPLFPMLGTYYYLMLLLFFFPVCSDKRVPQQVALSRAKNKLCLEMKNSAFLRPPSVSHTRFGLNVKLKQNETNFRDKATTEEIHDAFWEYRLAYFGKVGVMTRCLQWVIRTVRRTFCIFCPNTYLKKRRKKLRSLLVADLPWRTTQL